MEQHYQEVINSSRVVQTFTGFHMHEFVEKSKKKIAQGNCLILEWTKQETTSSTFYLKMNNFEFCKRVNQSTFVRVRYLKSTSYIFFNEFNDNLVYALSIYNQSPESLAFEDLLAKNGTLIDQKSPELKYEVKVRVDFHIQQILENEIIVNFNKAAKVGKAIGSFFGKINNTLAKKAAQAQARYQDQLNRITRESFSDSTKSKWGKIVQTASSLNQKLTQAVKPLNETISKAVDDVSQKYRQSNNEYVKAVREFAKETQDSINQGYITDLAPKPKDNEGGDLPGAEDKSVNMMGQHLILNEEVSEKSPYPSI